ncbi:hypothetical protein G3O08_20715, partial [Cryomorpha ignava]|nr:hypothetical protein [Cryomorpha ignava]
NLLGLPATMADVEAINFDNAGAGNCLIWFLSFDADNSNADEAAASFLEGNAVNAGDLTGCFDLSNSIEVVRENCASEFDCPDLEANFGDACDDGDDMTENDTVGTDCQCAGTPIFVCEADGGAIQFEDGSMTVNVCVDDNEPSTVDVAFATEPNAPEGYGATWVVTDPDLNLLGLPATMADVEAINFDNAGVGNCLIWFLSFNADNSNADEAAASFLEGNAVNAGDLTGCFDLSNSIEVVRENCASEFDCPDLEANFGDACDDGDDMTENDMVTTFCQCMGTPVEFDCPDLEANIGDACELPGAIGILNNNCECVPAPDCENYTYYLADHAAADGISDIYEVTLSGGVATMDYIATSDIEVHIAFSATNNLIYAVSKHE